MSQERLSWSDGHRLVNEIGSEEHLAARIVAERVAREWSQSELAREMAKVGCPIPQTAISKIEKPQRGGRRGISVQEAISFSKVFDIPLGELLLPINELISLSAMRLLTTAASSITERTDAEANYRRIVDETAVTAFKDQALLARLSSEREILTKRDDKRTREQLGRPAGWLAFLDDVFAAIQRLNDRAPKRAREEGRS